MFEIILKSLNASQIIELIYDGQINSINELIAAYNEILRKIEYENDVSVNLQMLENLKNFIKNISEEHMPTSTTSSSESSISNNSKNIQEGNGDNQIATTSSYSSESSASNTSKNIEQPVDNKQIMSEQVENQSPNFTVANTKTAQDNMDDTRGSINKKKYFNIIAEGVKHIKKFNIQAKTLTFKFNEVDEIVNPVLWLQSAFDEIIEHVSNGSNPEDKIGMVLRNQNFPEKPMCISFRRVDQLSSTVICSTLEKILQSNARFFAHDTMTLHVDRITLPTGYGRVKMTGVDFKEFCERKQGILVVNNTDNYCLARALVLAIAWRSKDSDLVYLEHDDDLMRDRAYSLCEKAGVNLSNGGTREHIEQFQTFLSDYTIVVYNSRIGKTVYFEGPRHPTRVVLNLIFENNHYNVITNLVSVFSCTYFCELCRTRSSNKLGHKNCPYICNCCHTSPPCNQLLAMETCSDCNRDFHGPICFSEHKKSLCGKLKRCLGCFLSVWVNPKKPHRCGYKYCNTCRCEKPTQHFCHMSKKPLDRKKMDKFFIFCFYDFECKQETRINGVTNTFLHEPNLCVAQNVCSACIDNEDISQDCIKCGKRQHIFKHSPVKDFLDYISKLGQKNTHVIALAHNMKGYDGIFILRELIEQCAKWTPKIISTGTKIMSIICNNIKFIDSLNFMSVPLSSLPTTFKFEGCKGYFPFLFNTTANQNYVGPMPPVEYYCPDEMNPKARDTFLKWYTSETENNTVFDMQRDIVQYCITDVDILRKACLQFCKIFTIQNNVEPFRECCTIAASVMLVFRRNFLEENRIGIIPHGGYRMADNQSISAIKWLLWIEYSEGIQIQHAGNSREKRLIGRILVDGYCENSNTVYNFHGCYFHGCRNCYNDQTSKLSDCKRESMFLRYEKTIAQASRIRSLGYNLIEIWGCEFTKFLKYNPRAVEFVNNHAIQKNIPLNPRDAFFGGRTNAVKLFHEVEDDDEVIKYLDVCSLYPFINKYGKYPIGHPKIHVGDESCRKLQFDSVNGLIKVTVLPPQNLYHPVLPHRLHNKLMFILCKTCGEQMNQSDCTHSINERKFTGTYVADELQKAVQLVYQILEFHEIWEYQVTQYNRDSKEGGLFSKFVNTFLKLKQECSGWPSWCVDEESKDRYITMYLEKEGIQLDKDNILFNAGLRYIAKIILNSFWGKLGQRENLNQTSIISDPYELFKMLTDPLIEVQSLITHSDEVVVVNWVKPDEAVTPLNTVNVVLAAYTTAHARLELYKYLEKLDRRVLYFDTDSILFSQKLHEWSPPIGDFLGDMTDEIGKGSKITMFVSGGPKNYGYKVVSEDGKHSFVCKVKGITLNYKNSEKINFETIRNMIINNLQSTYVETDRKIVRTPSYQVVSKPQKKIYRIQYTKRRRIIDSFDTLPYGFKLQLDTAVQSSLET